MFSESFKKSVLDFMLDLGLENLDAYENVEVKSAGSKAPACADLVCLTDSMMYVFIKSSSSEQPPATDKALLQRLNACETDFVSHFGIRTEKVMFFVADIPQDEPPVIYYRRPYSGELVLLGDEEQEPFSALQELIATQESYFQRVSASSDGYVKGFHDTSEGFFKSLSIQLDFASQDNEKVKQDSDGNIYVRKRNNVWVRASDLDSEKLFSLTVFGGFLGLHLFYQDKKAKGVLYLLTCGLFGIGWVFDALEMLFGTHRDKDGCYIIPPQINFIYIAFGFIAGLLFTLSGTFLYKTLFSLIIVFSKTLGEAFASEWVSHQ